MLADFSSSNNANSGVRQRFWIQGIFFSEFETIYNSNVVQYIKLFRFIIKHRIMVEQEPERIAPSRRLTPGGMRTWPAVAFEVTDRFPPSPIVCVRGSEGEKVSTHSLSQCQAGLFAPRGLHFEEVVGSRNYFRFTPGNAP